MHRSIRTFVFLVVRKCIASRTYYSTLQFIIRLNSCVGSSYVSGNPRVLKVGHCVSNAIDLSLLRFSAAIFGEVSNRTFFRIFTSDPSCIVDSWGSAKTDFQKFRLRSSRRSWPFSTVSWLNSLVPSIDHTNAFLKVPVFVSAKPKQNIFDHTSVFMSPRFPLVVIFQFFVISRWIKGKISAPTRCKKIKAEAEICSHTNNP